MIPDIRTVRQRIAELASAIAARLRWSRPAAAPVPLRAASSQPPASVVEPWPIEALKADKSAGSYLVRKYVLDYYAAAERYVDSTLPSGLNSVLMQRRYGFA
jgi:hypothetical protein